MVLLFAYVLPAKSAAQLFTHNLKLGSEDAEVFLLQQYLNQHGFIVASSGIGSTGNESDFFGTKTKLALIRFQNVHAAEILSPLGLFSGTGNFFKATRDFVNRTLVQNTAKVPTIISGAHHQSGSNSKIVPTIILNDIAKTYGDAPFALSASSDSDGAIIYESSDDGVATISGSTVTIVGPGTATITASQAASQSFALGSKAAILTVAGQAPTIAFDDLVEYWSGTPFAVTLAPTSDSSGDFSFLSSDPSVASISGSSCTVQGIGVTTITANQAANGVYGEGAKAANINVYSDPCSPDPCQNGGACNRFPDSYTCSCPDGFVGLNCDQAGLACGDLVCIHSDSCGDDGVSCACQPCFIGPTCSDFDVMNCA